MRTVSAQRAACLLLAVGVPPADQRSMSAVELADIRTSLADARTALCVARGVALDDIDPATGHDLSFRAYLEVQRGWASVLEVSGSAHLRRGASQARSIWAVKRPRYVGSDWGLVSADSCVS